MMNDWTDIIGEELREFEAPLPADDWDVLQQRRAAAARRRKVVAWSWAGAVSSVAAVVAVAVLLFRDDAVLPDGGIQPPLLSESNVSVVDTLEIVGDRVLEEGLVAESFDVTEPDAYVTDSDASEPSQNDEEGSADDERSGNQVEVMSEDAEKKDDVPQDENAGFEEEVQFDVVKEQKDSDTDRLLADNVGTGSGEEDFGEGGLRFEDLPGEKQRRRVRVSLAATGAGTFGGTSLMFKAMEPAGNVSSPSEEPIEGDQYYENLGDSLNVSSTSKAPKMMNSSVKTSARRITDTDYDHFQPVSFGVSARFFITDKFTLNTGLNYTLYSSRLTRKWSDGEVENLRQNVHYIGIPLRCDWLLVDRRYFSLYLGTGAQIDKAVYAKCGDERLHDRKFLFSLNAAMGIQYNVNDRFSLYLEPELTGNLNKPEIATFRSNRELMLSVRAGLRVNL